MNRSCDEAGQEGLRPRDFWRRWAWGVSAALVATIAYRLIQYATESRAVVRTECWSWSWLPFGTGWIWPYLSMFVVMGLPWFLLPTLSQMRRFAACLFATALVGWVVFIIFPTACARPSAEEAPLAYRLLLATDRPNNCLPCLHSAFPVLAIGALRRSRDFFRRRWVMAGSGLWLLLICASAIALRQHTGSDVIIGLGLGCGGAWLFRRNDDNAANAVKGEARGEGPADGGTGLRALPAVRDCHAARRLC